MRNSIFTRSLFARLVFTLVAGVQMLGWITSAQAGETDPPPPDLHKAERRALREFDRFLDHHPLMEDELRRDSQLTVSPVFLKKNPELRDFLGNNPKIAEGLRLYPHYFLNRGLLRQANAPVSFKELAAFRDLFQLEPPLEPALTESPELIRDPEFLKSHPALRDFLRGHPALGRVFLTPTTMAVHQ